MENTIGERIMNLRQKKGVSQEAFGEMLGVSRQAVSKWETGQAMPDLEKVMAMSEIFGVTTDYLLKGTENAQPQSDVQQEAQDVLSDSENTGFLPRLKKLKFEYKSKTTVFGIPLVHIKLGRAKGIFAVGIMATGLVSFGALSIGLLSLGLLSLGLIALGTFSLGGLSFGGIAAGIMAFGGVALGIFTVGGLSIGMYSLGGCAIASKIAFGGYANGFIAIGDKVNGEYTWCIKNGFTPEMREEVYYTIVRELPNTPNFILNLLK